MNHLFKLKQIILIVILLASYQSQATIIYTDITDILVSTPATADIDFNGDATAEFTLEDQGGFFGLPSNIVTNFNPNLINFVTQTATWDQFDPIPLGNLIDSTSSYNAAGDCYFTLHNGHFPTGDGHIGVRFQLNGNTHYGWVFVELHANATVTVKSYAYETSPNTGIAAGNTGSSSAILVTGITIQGQNGASSILENSNLQMEETVLPANATNNSVLWSVTNQTGTATIDPTTGVLSASTPGTVLVEATANDASGVSGSTVITIQQATSLTSIHSEQFKLYPNPAQNYFYVETKETALYQLFNLQGQEVQTGTLIKEKQKIACSLPKGLYMIHISFEKKKATQLISIN